MVELSESASFEQIFPDWLCDEFYLTIDFIAA
jgi:hypothetical protein